MEIIQTLMALDWAEITIKVLAAYGALKTLAALTPWTGDDKVLDAIGAILEKVGIKK